MFRLDLIFLKTCIDASSLISTLCKSDFPIIRELFAFGLPLVLQDRRESDRRIRHDWTLVAIPNVLFMNEGYTDITVLKQYSSSNLKGKQAGEEAIENDEEYFIAARNTGRA